jgi:hypothetical protein
MFWTTKVLQWTYAIVDALLGTLSTRPAAALLTTPKVDLYSAGPGLGPNMAYGAFTKCIYSGYASATLTPAGPVNLPGQVQGLLANALFTATVASPFVPDTAIGYFISDGAANVYAAELFTNPIPFASAGDFADLLVAMPLAASQPI